MIRPPAATPLGLNLAPMVDVMMCLLIFFMVATKMVEQESSAIDLPAARAAKEAERRQLGNRFVVNIRHAAKESGSGVVYIVREREHPLGGLLARLKEESLLDPAVNCVIRADKSVAYKDVEAVMIGCAAANISSITFSALRGEGGPP